MAVELESSAMSPRISFSHDFCQSDIVPVEQHPIGSSSMGIDFDFCVPKSLDQESSSADELFSNGKILPTEVKEKEKKKKKNINIPAAKQTISDQSKVPRPSMIPLPKEESLKGSSKIMRDEAGDDDLEEKQSSKSFWKFKRSSSMNCGSGYGRSLCPLPPLLSRSNSTGSASNEKRAALSKDCHQNHRENPQKPASIKSSHSSSSSSTSNYLKPPLKKNYGSYGSGIHINPVLNVPSGNLFGLGSIFSKDKNKKK